MAHPCNPSAGEGKMDWTLRLPSQSPCPTCCVPGHWENLSQRKVDSVWGKTPKVVLGMHTHTPYHTTHPQINHNQYCLGLSITVIKHYDQKQFREVRLYFTLQPMVRPSSRKVRARTQGRSLEAGTDEEATEECWLLAWSSWFARLVFFFYTPQNHNPRVAQPIMGWAFSHPSPIKQMHDRLVHRPVLHRHLFN